MSITGSNNPFACEPVVFANANSIVSLGTITRDGNQFTFSVGFVWKINGVTYQNTTPVVITIAEASTGFQRIDNALLNTSNTIELQQGLESDTIALRPTFPDNNILLTSWNISGDAIEDTETPIVGAQFKQKNESRKFSTVLSGTDQVIEFRAAGHQHYEISGTVTSVAGFGKTLLLASPSAEIPYAGKDIFFENNSGHNITLKNNFSGVDIKFDLGTDLVVPANGIVWLKYDATAENLALFFKSWTDLSTKADLVGGKVPAEQLPSYVDDVIEGYFNGTNFYTDSGFTNLITPESGKIYINIAVTPATQYRWSGSAYVQIGGGNDDKYPVKYLYQATGTGISTLGTNTIFSVGTGTNTLSNGFSYFRLTGAATAGTTIGMRESSFLRVNVNKGFKLMMRFQFSDASTITDVRFFHGLQVTSGFSNTNISDTNQPMCGIGADGTDTNIHVFSKPAAFGTLVKIDTGFIKTTTDEFLLTEERLVNSSNVVLTLKNLTTGVSFTSTVVNNSIGLTVVNHRNNNASNIACAFQIQRIQLNLSE